MVKFMLAFHWLFIVWRHNLFRDSNYLLHFLCFKRYKKIRTFKFENCAFCIFFVISPQDTCILIFTQVDTEWGMPQIKTPLLYYWMTFRFFTFWGLFLISIRCLTFKWLWFVLDFWLRPRNVQGGGGKEVINPPPNIKSLNLLRWFNRLNVF